MFLERNRTEGLKGFSLIEVGMVFAVVAMVAAGVIVGKNLYENAQVNAVERNIKDFTQSADKFSEAYGALPGDFSAASSYFGCTSCNGNGNGLLEVDADTNGDGTGDGIDETVLFWQHLRYAKMAAGKTETVGTNVYQSGPVDSTVYRVSQDESRGLVFELTGFQGSTLGYAAVKPGYAKNLDEKYDDGNPNTGMIRASNGSGLSTCVSGATYTASTDYAACVINLSMQKEGGVANDDDNLTQLVVNCDSSNIGEVRPSATKCPDGYSGTILESCGRSGWRVTSKNCAPVSCGGGYYNDTRVISCPPGYTGTQTQTCGAGGGWATTGGTCTVGGTCTIGASMTTQCPYGYSGKKVLSCPAGTWVEDDSSGCTQITCTSGATTKNVGESFSDSTACPTGFTGSVLKTCTSDGAFVVSSNTCTLVQNTSCTPLASTRTLTCPSGMNGTVAQECKTASGGGNIWVTTQYTCSPIMCGDKPVGYIRQSQQNCASGYTGYKEEVCQATGLWEVTANTCAANVCPGESVLESTFNATFVDTNAGSNGTGTCSSGYSNNPTAPVLACNTDGTWATSLTSGGCTLAGGVKYVAVTNGGQSTSATWGCQIYTSSDGINWTARTTQASSPFGTTACTNVGTDGMGNWIIVGGSGKIMTSTDGINWTLRNSGVAVSLWSVAHNGQSGANSLWMVVGHSNVVIKSTDGITWTAGTGAFTAGTAIHDIAHNGLSGNESRFMANTGAATSPAKIAITTDASSWTALTSPLTQQYSTVVSNRKPGFGNTVWAITNASGTFYSSSDDGRTWTARVVNAGTPYYYFTDYDYSINRWIASSGSGANSTRYSDDNFATWTITSNITSPQHKVFVHNRLPNGLGGLWIAAGSQDGSISYYSSADIATYGTSMLSTSADGITWTPRAFPSMSGSAKDERVRGLAAAAANSCSEQTLALNASGSITGTFAATADSTTYTASCSVGDGYAVRRCENGTWSSLLTAPNCRCSESFFVTSNSLVNTYTTNDQESAKIATLTGGGYVVMWTSDDQDGDSYGVYFQLFAVDGTKVGAEIRANTVTALAQDGIEVLALANGGFVIGWEDGTAGRAKFRIFDSNGSPVTGELNVSPEVDSWFPKATLLQNGNFMIVYYGWLSGATGSDVYGRVFDSSGTQVTAQFKINTYVTSNQRNAFAATLTGGNVAVVWTSSAQDGSGWGMYGQIITPQGVKVGSEFMVNTYTTGHQGNGGVNMNYYGEISIAALENGNFVVAWTSEAQDGSTLGVYGQIFSPTGAKVGSEFLINAVTTGDQHSPKLVALPGGYFYALWESWNVDGDEEAIVGQLFDSSGAKVGYERMINGDRIDGQHFPGAALLSNGNMAVAWHDGYADGYLDYAVSQRIINPWGQFLPTDLPGIKLWLGADSGITKDGSNYVSAWTDQSGAGSNGIQGNPSLQPVWVDNQVNGKPIVRFDGSNDTVYLGNQTMFNSAVGATVSAVVKRNGAGGVGSGASTDNTIFDASTSNSANPRVELVVDSSNQYSFRARRADADATATLSSGSSGTSSFALATSVLDIANRDAFLYANGSLLTSNLTFTTAGSTFVSLSSSAIRIGAQAPGTTGHLNADFAEIIVYNQPLLGQNRVALECYLSNKYNLGLTCPNNNEFCSN